eukprot:scpid39808/ scgid11749/ Putative nuclease HARBI1; Harbinger transposase-derived nuclease
MDRISNMDDERKRILAVCLSVSAQILAELDSSSSDGEETEDEDVLVAAATAGVAKRRKTCDESDCVPVPKKEEPSGTKIIELSDSTFREYFRVSRTTFEGIAQRLLVLPDFQARYPHGGRVAVAGVKQLQVALWTLGTRETFKLVASRFSLSRSTCHSVLKRVVRSLAITIAASVIHWPAGERIKAVEEGFRRRSEGFPGILGAVDVCHIAIKAPTSEPSQYMNSESYHSVIVQGACDHEYLFTDIDVGRPGGTHSASVFEASELAKRLPDMVNEDQYLVGDNTYPLRGDLMVPYLDPEDLGQQQYNGSLFMAHQCIAHSFALLKCRWRRLNYVDGSDFDLLVQCIAACCVLHNLCLQSNDGAEDMIASASNGVTYQGMPQDPVYEQSDQAVVLKRDNIQVALASLP